MQRPSPSGRDVSYLAQTANATAVIIDFDECADWAATTGSVVLIRDLCSNLDSKRIDRIQPFSVLSPLVRRETWNGRRFDNECSRTMRIESKTCRDWHDFAHRNKEGQRSCLYFKYWKFLSWWVPCCGW